MLYWVTLEFLAKITAEPGLIAEDTQFIGEKVKLPEASFLSECLDYCKVILLYTFNFLGYSVYYFTQNMDDSDSNDEGSVLFYWHI